MKVIARISLLIPSHYVCRTKFAPILGSNERKMTPLETRIHILSFERVRMSKNVK